MYTWLLSMATVHGNKFQHESVSGDLGVTKTFK